MNTAGELEVVVGEVDCVDRSEVVSMCSSSVVPDKHLSSSPFWVLAQDTSPVLLVVILRMRILGVLISQKTLAGTIPFQPNKFL